MSFEYDLFCLLKIIAEGQGTYYDKRGLLTSEGLKALSLAIKISGRRKNWRLKKKLEELRRDRRVDLLLEILKDLDDGGEELGGRSRGLLYSR
ncbi:MAG: hypothetical protein QXV55_00100 [Acidilobaceae archaeon]